VVNLLVMSCNGLSSPHVAFSVDLLGAPSAVVRFSR